MGLGQEQPKRPRQTWDSYELDKGIYDFLEEQMKDLVVYYRTSDAGYPKDKPSYVNNFSCLYNFLKEFPFKKCQYNSHGGR